MATDPLAIARCLACKYALRGLPEGTSRCPECGRPFNISDPRTFDDGSPGINWTRWARPPGWIHSILIVVLCTGVLYEQSYPFGWFLPCAVVLLLPLAAVYLLRALISLSIWLSRIPPIRRRSCIWWFVAPLSLLIVIGSVATHAPLRVRFAYSQEALEAEARRLLAATPAASQPDVRPGRGRYFTNREIGAYFVGIVDVDQVRQHVYFNIGPGIRPHGLVYLGDSTEQPEEDHWRVPYLPAQWELFASP